ncbi:MAG: 30S ribosomal protein S20 [bacterium]
MPNVRSAEKRLKQSERRRERNRAAKAAMKTAFKKTVTAIETGDRNEAEKQLKLFVSKVDAIARKGIIHKNNAANKKSKITRMFNGKFA